MANEDHPSIDVTALDPRALAQVEAVRTRGFWGNAGNPSVLPDENPASPMLALSEPAALAYDYSTEPPVFGNAAILPFRPSANVAELSDAAMGRAVDQFRQAQRGSDAATSAESPAADHPLHERATALEAKKAAAVEDVDAAIRRTPLTNTELLARLKQLLQDILGANSLKTLQTILTDLSQTITAAEAAGQMETPEAHNARLWGEIKTLDEDTRTRMQRLLREGKITQSAYDDWDKADKQANDPSLDETQRLAATTNAANYADAAVKGLSGTDPDHIRNNSDELRHRVDEIHQSRGNTDSKQPEATQQTLLATSASNQSNQLLPQLADAGVTAAAPDASNANLPSLTKAAANQAIDLN